MAEETVAVMAEETVAVMAEETVAVMAEETVVQPAQPMPQLQMAERRPKVTDEDK